jgi:tetratricopeptide (TPR) repeat protein
VAEVVAQRVGWHVALEDAGSVAELCAAVSAALGLSPTPGDPVERLGVALASRQGVLALDGVDRIAGELEPALDRWRLLAPDLRVVLVARRRVLADEEVVLAPLDAGDATALLHASADDAWVDADPAALQALLAALDGLPLAIELAAAQAAHRSVPEVIASLTGGPHPGPLQAALASAWRGLDAVQRAALAQLTVFAGGWDLAAAQAVLALGERWAVDLLQALADHSLVQVDPRTGRFRLLGAVRAFAAEQLDAPTRDRTERRHGEHYARLYALYDPLRVSPDHADDLRLVATERENLLAATRRAIHRRDGPVAAVCALGICFATASGAPSLALARGLVEDVLAHAGPMPTTLHAEVRATVGALCANLGDCAAASDHFARALDTARTTGDAAIEALVEMEVGNSLWKQGDPDGAAVFLERARSTAERLGHRRLLSRATADLGVVYRRQGRPVEAARLTERALVLYREVRALRSEVTALNNLANVREHLGEHEASRALYLEALRRLERTGNATLTADVYGNLALVEWRLGRMASMVSYLERALRIRREQGSVPGQLVELGNLGGGLVQRGDFDRARLVLEEGVRLSRAPGLVPYGTVALGNLGLLELWCGAPERAEAHVQQAVREEQDARDPVGEMGMRVVLALVARARGDLEGATAGCDAVVRFADAGGHPALAAMARLERGLSWLARGDV